MVTFPDVPEIITQGEDEEEALLRAQDALETALSMYVEDGHDLLNHASRLDQLEQAPAVLGKRLYVEIQDAA